MVRLRDLSDEHRKQAIAQIRTTIRNRKPKQGRESALVKEKNVPRLYTPVYFRVTVFRKGHNWDTNNIETKAILDGLVAGGVIPDDRIVEVPKEYKEGIEAENKQEEKTIIEVIPL